MVIHIIAHSEYIPHKCGKCAKQFSIVRNLTFHMLLYFRKITKRFDKKWFWNDASMTPWWHNIAVFRFCSKFIYHFCMTQIECGVIFLFKGNNIAESVRAYNFSRIKKIPYQAPPTQLGPQKFTLWKNAFQGPKY